MLTPLLNTWLFCSEESQREAKPLLLKIFPLSLKGEGDKGRGIKGVRVMVIGRKPRIKYGAKSEAIIKIFKNKRPKNNTEVIIS